MTIKLSKRTTDPRFAPEPEALSVSSADPHDTPHAVTLYEFSLSHYNEKARWALDYKGIEYESHLLLPGFHFRTIKKLSGQTGTPVVVVDGDVVSGSAKIVARVDELASDHVLIPSQPDARKKAEEWVRWLDDEVGPPVRLALFDALLVDRSFASTFFSGNLPKSRQTFYRWTFPLVAPVIKKQLNVNPEAATKAREFAGGALTRVASAARETGYLVGDNFTVADLTACALFFPLFYPEQVRGHVPDREHPVFKGWLDRWRDHEGREYVERIYAKHRMPVA